MIGDTIESRRYWYKTLYEREMDMFWDQRFFVLDGQKNVVDFIATYDENDEEFYIDHNCYFFGDRAECLYPKNYKDGIVYECPDTLRHLENRCPLRRTWPTWKADE